MRKNQGEKLLSIKICWKTKINHWKSLIGILKGYIYYFKLFLGLFGRGVIVVILSHGVTLHDGLEEQPGTPENLIVLYQVLTN